MKSLNKYSKSNLAAQFRAERYSAFYSPHRYKLTYTTPGGKKYTMYTSSAYHFDELGTLEAREELRVKELISYRHLIKSYHIDNNY